MSRVQAVVYMTRSVYEAENENVVSRAVEQINLIQQRKFPYRVVPPVLPFTGYEIEKGIGICGKFIKFPATDKHSGCFVAVLTREVSHPLPVNSCQLDNNRLIGWKVFDVIFKHYFSYIKAASSSIHSFLMFLFKSILHNIFSKPLAVLPYNHLWRNGQQWLRNESFCCNYHQCWERILAKPVIKPIISCPHVHMLPTEMHRFNALPDNKF